MVKYHTQSMPYFFFVEKVKRGRSPENLVLFRSIALLVVPVIFFYSIYICTTDDPAFFLHS